MPSAALEDWNTKRQRALDEIEQAHRAIGGAGRGRRYASQQLNHAYAVLLSSQFQAFCRDLHTEAVKFLVANTLPAVIASALLSALTRGRKLDYGNPNPGNIGSDFARFELEFWADVDASDPRGRSRRKELESLNDWRNAIAHQDWSRLGRHRLSLGEVRKWRSACRGLATSFDRVMRRRLHAMVGNYPW